MTDAIIRKGYDYILIDPTYTTNCGCKGNVNAIKYGTQIGFDCVADASQEVSEDCGGYRGCQTQDELPLVVFCPAGHTPTCSGCQKLLEPAAETTERYEWMVNVMTGYMRETKDTLDMQPRPSQVVAC